MLTFKPRTKYFQNVLICLLLVLLTKSTLQEKVPAKCAPFNCLSCKEKEGERPYITSCQQFSTTDPLFLTLTIFAVLSQFFMLSIGFGMYQILYGYLQLASLFIWVPEGYTNGIIALQGTNLGVFVYNNFALSFGVQMVLIIFLICVFFILVATYERIPHNKVAKLIRRKRITFPTRLLILFYNFIFFASIASISTINNSTSLSIFNLVYSVIGLIIACTMLVSVFFLCNFKKFKLDDPNYYVISERMVSRRWWVKNNLFVLVTNSTILMMVFVLGFKDPKNNWVVMAVFQAIFTLYVLILLPYIKLRYKFFNVLGSLLFLAIIIVMIQLSNEPTNSLILAHKALVALLCIALILASVVEIVICHKQINRYLIEVHYQYLLCDEKYEINDMNERLYRSEVKREKVLEFQDNAVYGMDLGEIRDPIKSGPKEDKSNYESKK